MPSENCNLTVKDVYEKSAAAHQYFLNWRHRLFAGYVAVLAALGVAGSWAFEKNCTYAFSLIPLASVVVTTVLWALDFRTRDLYRACQRAAADCEIGNHGPPNKNGVYSALSETRTLVLYHSLVFDLFFLLVILFSWSSIVDLRWHGHALIAVAVSVVFSCVVVSMTKTHGKSNQQNDRKNRKQRTTVGMTPGVLLSTLIVLGITAGIITLSPQRTNTMPAIYEFISQLGPTIIGLAALVVTYMTVSRQIRASTVSSSRQHWVNLLQETLTQFLTTMASRSRVFSDPTNEESHNQYYNELNMTHSRLTLMLKKENKNHQELLSKMKALILIATGYEENTAEAVKRASEFGVAREALLAAAQTVMDSEWSKIKQGT